MVRLSMRVNTKTEKITNKNLYIAENAILILPLHGELDGIREDAKNTDKIGTWKYYNKKGKMITEEKYFTCGEKCADSHFPRPCKKEGKVRTSKDY